MNDTAELERLRREAIELRALVRDLSERLAALVGSLPLEAALALARGADATAEPPLSLEPWNETIEMTRTDLRTELPLLWKRLPPRESP